MSKKAICISSIQYEKEQCTPCIQPLEPHNASEVSQQYVEAGKQMTGGEVINYFKQMSVSPASFKGYMDLSQTLQGGSLDRKLQESIAVAVSDFNGCTYCLSVHSGLAKQEGLSEDEREQAQQFESENPKRAAALHFVREVVESRGHPQTRLWTRPGRQDTPTSRSWR
jgi:AhpD family alkylhydroperoxidase